MTWHFPDIDPIAFSLGPLKIHWYGIAYLLGILGCWQHAKRLVPYYKGWRVSYIDDMITYCVIGIILGGRLGFVLFYDPLLFFYDPLSVLKTWQGGMSFHGGFIGFSLSLSLYAYKKKIPLLSLGDICAIVAPFGLFLGRLANFINAEHYGRPTELSIGMIFPHSDGLSRHPSQLYEALLEGVILWIILNSAFKFFKTRYKPGFYVYIFNFFYGIFRFLVEYVRDPDGILSFQGIALTLGQWLSLPMILIGIIGTGYVLLKHSSHRITHSRDGSLS